MKTYLITGATSGIGKALTESFKNEDVRVIAIGRNTDKLSKLKQDLATKVEILPIELDLSEVSSIKSSLSSVLSEEIDGFIHCAGIYHLANLRKIQYQQFVSMMNVNFFSFVEILKLLVAKKNKDKQFRVVAMSSIASIRAGSTNSMYAATKGALDSFVRAISGELNLLHVEINTLQPAFVNTPMIDDLEDCYGDKYDNFIKSFQPLGLIPVEDIVEEIKFLLNKRSNKVTGTSILINGGRC